MLILARTGFATGPVQHALAHAGIAHRVLGALGLYERAEVRDALAYLTLLANPADAQAFRRAIGSPRRGVGTATANRIVAHARSDHDGDLIAACAHAGALAGIRGAGRRPGRAVRRAASSTSAASWRRAGRSGTPSCRR